MIANFAPRRGGTASFVILLGGSRLDVRTSRKVGVAMQSSVLFISFHSVLQGACGQGGTAQLLA